MASDNPLLKSMQKGAAPQVSISLFMGGDDDDDCPDSLIEVPDVRQPDHYSCGACAAMSVGRYFGVGPTSVGEWKKALGTDVQESTEPEAIVDYLNSLGLKAEGEEGCSIDDLKEYWCQGMPCIVCVQDYGPSVPAQARFSYGHYLVVIGVAFGYVFCQDSSEDNVIAGNDSIQKPGRIMVAQEDFDKMWHDKDAAGKKYDHYAICVSKP